jgi:hypothetical protein
MHHFSTSTCFTLSNNTEIREIWRTSIPRIGFKRPYVLQALLTLSALHIARYRPEKRSFYEAYAAREIESALRKASGLISNITEENCSAVLTFSLLATLNSLATPRKESNLLLVGKNGITEWLYTFRGMGQIVHGSWQGILKGELEPLIRASKSCLENGTSAPPETAALEGLKTTLEESTSPIANIEAVDQLLISFSIIHNRSRSSCEAPSVMVWPCSVSNAFINLLSEREPWSLVVLAYFCVLLKKAEGFWWMEGWPVHVLGHIYQLLDPLYRLNIRWPMECIGWVPPS